MSTPESHREVARRLARRGNATGHDYAFGGTGYLLTDEERRPQATDRGILSNRNVVADWLEDNGRSREADLLRDHRQHVVVRDGVVRPGRFNIGPMAAAYGRLQDHLTHMTGGDHGATWEIHYRDAWPPGGTIADPGWATFVHPGEGDDESQWETETYHATEARDRLVRTLRTMHGLDPATGKWPVGEERGPYGGWSRLRSLIDTLASTSIEEVNTDHPLERWGKHLQ